MIYTAITIGPIYETISLTSSPAGLWAASYLFSHISQRFCALIVENSLVESEELILSPYYCADEVIIDGIGRYHDRIVFLPKDPLTVLTKLEDLFGKITEEVASVFDHQPVEWFKDYLQIHALNFESNDNPILDCSVFLDTIELEKTFRTGEITNPLNELFESSYKNLQIRERIRNNFSGSKWPFTIDGYNDGKSEKLPDMEYITGRFNETDFPRKKTKSYYAIVQSDGDRIGEYIKSCKQLNVSERDFSKKCLDYCSAAVVKIKEFGGVPIYAGGDDLLFLSPLESIQDNRGNLLTLIDDLTILFTKIFSIDTASPTLSFGVAIRYYKYPLYEAFDEAQHLLFEQAKINRNAVAISLQKHSGQDIRFVLENFTKTEMTEMKAKLQGMIEQQLEGDVLQSIRNKLWEFQPLFIKALSLNPQALQNIFNNTFDSNEHKTKQADIDAVRELLEMLEIPDNESKLRMLDHLLRFVKFWGEKGEESVDEMVN